MRWFISLSLVLACFGLFSTSSAFALEVGTGEPFGGVWAQNKEDNARTGMDMNAELGVQWHREWISWKDWQSGRGSPLNGSSQRMLDYVQSAAGAKGLKVFGVIDGAPQWANGSSDPALIPGNGNPEDPAFQQFVRDYGDFVYSMASMYRGRINNWELWIEPDLSNSWKTSSPVTVEQRADGYALLLKTAYVRAKEANPDVVIITGGITAWQSDRYMRELYRQGAGPYFDKANIHPWTENPQAKPDQSSLFAKIGSLRQIMDQNGDADKKIWVTAFGYSTAGSDPRRVVTEDQRSEYMINALDTVISRYPSVEVFTFFRLMDRNWYTPDDMEAGFGLLYTDVYRDGSSSGHARFERKPAFYALKDHIREINSENPQLELSTTNTYWADYQDYTSRLVSVDYTLGNSGSGRSIGANITSVQRLTRGVTAEDTMPMAVGDLASSQSRGFSLRFRVPPGVSSFTVSLTGETRNSRGEIMTFPATA